MNIVRGRTSGGSASSDVREILSKRIGETLRKGESNYGALLSSANAAYEKSKKQPMPEMRQAILSQSIENYVSTLIRSGKIPNREYIKSAADNIWDVENPVTMLLNLMSIVVPNFSFMEACGVQPMPTKESPILVPQLSAKDTRGGVTAGDKLLGGDGWSASNNYTTNRDHRSLTVTNANPNLSYTCNELPVLPGTAKITYVRASGTNSFIVTDNGSGVFTHAQLTSGTIDYTTGIVVLVLASNGLTGDTCTLDWRYDLDQYDPAQVVFEWVSKNTIAYPRRIRSTYALDNFYAAKKILDGYSFDLDAALSSSMAGYINKEISCGIFDDVLDQSTLAFTWASTLPSGVSWAFHRLSIIEPIIAARNEIRRLTYRAGGNVLIGGNKMSNIIESLGSDVFEPKKYEKEPIGPYVAGEILGKIKFIKNQDYPVTKSAMVYKTDDTDASFMVGVHMGLYATDPLAMDNLKVIQGMGTQLGTVKVFSNSVADITIGA